MWDRSVFTRAGIRNCTTKRTASSGTDASSRTSSGKPLHDRDLRVDPRGGATTRSPFRQRMWLTIGFVNPAWANAPSHWRLRRCPPERPSARRRRLLLSDCNSPGGAGEAAALVLAAVGISASAGADQPIRPLATARVLHRPSGRAAVIAVVGVAGLVPKGQCRERLSKRRGFCK